MLAKFLRNFRISKKEDLSFFFARLDHSAMVSVVKITGYITLFPSCYNRSFLCKGKKKDLIKFDQINSNGCYLLVEDKQIYTEQIHFQLRCFPKSSPDPTRTYDENCYVQLSHTDNCRFFHVGYMGCFCQNFKDINIVNKSSL